MKKWWIERAAPAAKGKLSRITKRVRPPTEEANGQGSIVEPVHYSVYNSAENFTDVDSVFEQPQISMSSAEWQKGFRAWMAATAVEEALRKMLANARIDDDDEVLLELQAATKHLTPQQRAVIANRVLEISPASLDDEAFTKLVKIFGEGRIVDRQYVPVELEEPKEAARLTHEEM